MGYTIIFRGGIMKSIKQIDIKNFNTRDIKTSDLNKAKVKEQTMSPITNPKNITKVAQWLKTEKNEKGALKFDPAYHLIYLIGIETGYRITDITEIRYDDINFDAGTINLIENKGTRSGMAKNRLRVLKEVKEEILHFYESIDEPDLKFEIARAAPKDIYQYIPELMLDDVNERINNAIMSTELKRRTATLKPSTLKIIKARMSKYSAIDEGNLFARSTLSSNRARNAGGVISRQSCHNVFKQLSEILATLGEKIRVSCHGLRKTFALTIYKTSGFDIAKLMKSIGHSSQEMSLRYIGLGDKENLDAMRTAQASYS